MHAHDIGHAPGLVAPEAPTSVRLKAPKDSAPMADTIRSREENEHSDSASDDGSVKAFATLRARLALREFQMHRQADGTLLVIRWNLAKTLPSLDAAERFAEQAGA